MTQNKQIQFLFLLAFLSGFVLLLSWMRAGTFFLLFFAFLPTLFIIDYSEKYAKNILLKYLVIYIPFLIWNLDNLWIYKVNKTGGILTVIVNAIFVSWPWFLNSIIRFKHKTVQYIFLLSSVLACEINNHTWQIAYPFFTIGNGLAVHPHLIQWYDITGVFGGTTWILTINILLYELFIKFHKKIKVKDFIPNLSILLAVLILPTVFSVIRFNKWKTGSSTIEIVSIHSRIDVYSQKYLMTNQELVEKYLQYTSLHISDSTRFVFWPETAIPHSTPLNKIHETEFSGEISKYLQNWKNCKIISGIVITDSTRQPLTSGKIIKSSLSDYNAAIMYPLSNNLQIKTKDFYVPFTEMIPFPAVLSFLSEKIPALAGYKFAKHKEFGNNQLRTNNIAVQPMICYESAFYKGYRRKNDTLNSFIAVILNEGWYKDSRVDTYFQCFAQLRAIENRKVVVRSSNMGISGLINTKGEVLLSISDFGPKSFAARIETNNTQTVFQKICRITEITVTTLFLLFIVWKLIDFIRKLVYK
jgi:apolipoprotein N-acyltransferase